MSHLNGSGAQSWLWQSELIVHLFGASVLRRGDLIEVLPKHRASPMPMTLFDLHREPVSRRFQVFAERLEPLLKSLLSPP
ncbi:hypothetical protein IHE33_10085 [Mycetohabitans endofungorum]